MLRVQLATSVGSAPVSLMQQCTSILQAGTKALTRFSILMLLSTWLANSPPAVLTFLSIPSAVPYLTTHVSANEHDELEIVCQGLCAFLLGLCIQFNDGSSTSFTSDSLRQLVTDRIGAENFNDKLVNISKMEAYTKAAKSPQVAAKQPSDLVFDHEFCRLFKSLEETCVRAVTPQLGGGDSGGEVSPAEVTRYKDIIRDQDAEITTLRDSVADLQHKVEEDQRQREQLAARVQQLHDENTVLKAQQGFKTELQEDKAASKGGAEAGGEGSTGGAGGQEEGGEQLSQQVTLLQQQLAEMTHARDYYYYEMYKKDTELTALQQQQQGQEQQEQPQVITENGVKNPADFFDSLANPEMENLRKQLEDLQLVLYNKDAEIQQLQEAAAQPATNPPTTATYNGLPGADTEVPEQNGEESTKMISKLEEENTSLKKQVKEYEIHVQQLLTQLETTAAATAAAAVSPAIGGKASELSADMRCKQLEEELDNLRREQEDLLVLVTDQDSKVSEYRRRLRAYGDEVTDEEIDEDDDGDDYGISDNYDDDDDSQ